MGEIVPGLTGEYQTMVTEANTAKHLGSGNVEVFATPEMVRLMERAGVAAVDHLLPNDTSSMWPAFNSVWSGSAGRASVFHTYSSAVFCRAGQMVHECVIRR